MNAPAFLGIEIGGTKLQLGLGLADGRLLGLERLAVRPEEGGEGIRRQIIESVDPFLERVGARRTELAAVGIGFGGPVDADRGVVTVSNQVEGWEGFPIADWTRRNLGVAAVSLQNDADTAGLGEALFGAGAGLSPILYVTIGSGIGGGLIIDGRIYRGSGRGAVEIGHLLVRNRVTGGTDRLERVASGWAIGRLAREVLGHSTEALERFLRVGRVGSIDEVTAVSVAAAASAGDPSARMILDVATDAFAACLSHAVTLLAPARVILGGGVSLMPEDLWLSPIRSAVDRWVFEPFQGTFDIVPALLGEEVVLHGAIAHASEAFRQYAQR